MSDILKRGTPLGVADSAGREIKVGDYLRRACAMGQNVHGDWCVWQVVMVASFPVLSYCYSAKGKQLPTGYMRCHLSDLYDRKGCLWASRGRLFAPSEDTIHVMKKGTVDFRLAKAEFGK